jgi:sialidase-1
VQTLFEAGTEGYHTFRIPALLTLHSGVVLAFAEGRRSSASDTGWIDTVVRRSRDGGRTWGPLRVVGGESTWEGVTGNPCPVQDRDSGRVVLTLCRNRADGPEAQIMMGRAPRTVWMCHSDDDGLTWSPLREITPQVKRSFWTWYATGPGHGIQLPSGRLVIACDHAIHPEAIGESEERALELAESLYRAHLILSDDGGLNWRIGAVVEVPGTNESCVAEMGDGLYLNSRHHGSEVRHGAFSETGESLARTISHPEMTDPVCQGSALSSAGELLVCHCAGPGRTRLTVRASKGATAWRELAVVCEGPSAYSDLCEVEGRLLCLFETGDEHAYERIVLAEIPR